MRAPRPTAAPRSGPTTSRPPTLPDATQNRFSSWCAALEERHLAHLTFQEVRRALTALSTVYVERRDRLPAGAALDGAGKRAAFAMFYGPLHFLTVHAVVEALGAAAPSPREIVDLGCGTGVGGAAWALAAAGQPTITGVDENRWVIEEARWTFDALGVRGRALSSDVLAPALGGEGAAIIAAYTINELAPEPSRALLERMLAAAKRGARLLVVEPIARRNRPMWDVWQNAITGAGGRYDEWSFPADLPARLRLLDKAAGLRHDALKARSLYLPAHSDDHSR